MSSTQRSMVWDYFVFDDERRKTICQVCGVELIYNQSTSSMRNHLRVKHDVSLPAANNINPNRESPSAGIQRSKVWRYFQMDPERTKVRCQLCYYSCTYTSSTSNMLNHLRSKHAEWASQEECAVGSSGGAASLVAELDGKSYTRSSPMINKAHRAKKLQEKLLDLCAQNLLPPSAISGGGMNDFMKSFDPICPMPTLSSLEKGFSDLYFAKKHCLLMFIHTQEHVAVSVNICRVTLESQYALCSVHFLDKDWVLRNYVLTLKEMKSDPADTEATAAEVDIIIQEVKSEYWLGDKVTAVVSSLTPVSSQAATEQMPCISLPKMLVQQALSAALQHQSCDSQKSAIRKCAQLLCAAEDGLNLSVIDFSKQMEINVDEYFLQLVTKKEKQSVMEYAPQLVAMEPVVTAILSNQEWKSDLSQKLGDTDLGNEYIATLKQLSDVILPTMAMATQFYKNEPALFSSMPPFLQDLAFSLGGKRVHSQQELNEQENTGFSELFGTALNYQAQLLVRTPPAPVLVSSLLDPRYKDLSFLNNEQLRDAAIENLIRLVYANIKKQETSNGNENNDNNGQDGSQDEDNADEGPSAKRHCSGIENVSLDNPDALIPKKEWQKAKKEVDGFLSQTWDGSPSPLEWWKNHEKMYPNVAKLARKYLCLCCPQFSYDSMGWKHIIGLGSDMMEKLIFLHHNQSLTPDQSFILSNVAYESQDFFSSGGQRDESTGSPAGFPGRGAYADVNSLAAEDVQSSAVDLSMFNNGGADEQMMAVVVKAEPTNQ